MGFMLIENKDQTNYSFDTISACINTKKNEIVYLETIFLNGCVVLLLFPIVLQFLGFTSSNLIPSMCFFNLDAA